MNETIKVLTEHSTIRNFKDTHIKDEHLKLIKESIKRSPSAGNMQDYFVIIVTDEELRTKLSILCDNQPLIKKAPMSLIFVTDITKHLRAFNLVGIDTEKNNIPTYAHMFNSIVNSVIAAQSANIACESLNIGTCYIGDIIEHKKSIRSLLNLEKYQIPITMISIGYYDTQKKLNTRNSDEFFFYENTYKRPTDDQILNLFDKRIPKKFQDKYNTYIEYEYNRKTATDFFKEMTNSITDYVNEYY